jgi:nitric oxide reductase subunit B
MITPMHGHSAFFGAYVMINLAIISFAMPHLTKREVGADQKMGYWAFWLMAVGMFGMTLAFGAAGIAQTYLERIMGLGYLETQLKLQVHFLMLSMAGIIFVIGSALFIIDFFRVGPRPLPAAAAPGTVVPETGAA